MQAKPEYYLGQIEIFHNIKLSHIASSPLFVATLKTIITPTTRNMHNNIHARISRMAYRMVDGVCLFLCLCLYFCLFKNEMKIFSNEDTTPIYMNTRTPCCIVHTLNRHNDENGCGSKANKQYERNKTMWFLQLLYQYFADIKWQFMLRHNFKLQRSF